MSSQISESIVLRTYPYKEADLIVSFFTRDQGKLRGIARRARKPSSKFGAGLERLAHGKMQYFLAENRDLATLDGCEVIGDSMNLSADYDRSRAHLWLQQHVLPKLRPGAERTRSRIASDLRAVVGDARPEFWAWFGEYDWIVLRQLFGDLTAWPKGWPLSHMNLEQWRLHLGAPPLVQPVHADLHHALADARWTREAWQGLHDLQAQQTSRIEY